MERNDSVQIETNNETGHIMKARVRWLNDCEFELSNVLESKDSFTSLKPTFIGRVITTKILEANNNYCVYESQMNGVSMRIIDTLFVLKR